LYYYKFLKLKRIVVAGAHQGFIERGMRDMAAGSGVAGRGREYCEDQIDRYDRAAGLDIQGESQGLIDIQIPYIF
jgi:hypothetical protein